MSQIALHYKSFVPNRQVISRTRLEGGEAGSTLSSPVPQWLTSQEKLEPPEDVPLCSGIQPPLTTGSRESNV